eukprot:TRINITY_DN63751_c0_g1_i1.p1 TRINITY_DN63751_c0_g1~~TRINITY_DN63751_c0_g1_i1.p1  ORF type:complete len:595 (+),score=137.77 TRINITY_DN63751_c0_g1_i1:112-1896(+)
MAAFGSAILFFVAALVVLAPVSVSASSEAVPHPERKSGAFRRSSLDPANFHAEIRNAVGEALGCGGQVSEAELQLVEKSLRPIYQTMPKNSYGRLERRSLRHLAHRYFSQRSSLTVRGFEPSRPVTEEKWGAAEVLSQRVPGFVEAVLESRHAQEHGFDIRDAAILVSTLEQLIFDAESALLEKVYKDHFQDLRLDDVHGRRLGQSNLKQVLEDYMVHWLMGDDQEGISILLGNRTMLDTLFPHWKELVAFAHGQIKALDYERVTSPMAAATTHGHAGGNAMSSQYSFDDAHAIVGGITKSFASFWESECTTMKEQLVAMDTHRTGRIPLSKFYGTGLDADWRFGESEQYLRELGALDETGSGGKQVVIPNYIQAASNCIVTTSHYMVCCQNDCNSIMSDIEAAVAAATADPAHLLEIVGNMTSMTSFEDESTPSLDSTMKTQLHSIAEAHGGRVPIHGRLFMQWLHYAFPRECPFPHLSGTVASVAPLEFAGGSYIASKEEMQAHKADNSSDIILNASMTKEDLQWMSQWNEEEELFATYEGLTAKDSWSRCYLRAGFGVLLAGALGFVNLGRKQPSGPGEFLLPTYTKAHLV